MRELVQPVTWAEALAAKAERPGLMPIAGGTDVMVDLNFDRCRPESLLDLTRVADRDVITPPKVLPVESIAAGLQYWGGSCLGSLEA